MKIIEELLQEKIWDGPKVTMEDIVTHEAISAIIHKDKKILMFKHVKYEFWTIPIGKVRPGQKVSAALKEELQEECGITPTKLAVIAQFEKVYNRGKGVKTTVNNHVCDIIEYKGTVTNKEPEKHSQMKWMTIQEIKRIKDISDATKAFLKTIET
jgi:ADP-ribose pyrophosphatase YjhB (NUDIX family)